ncbi:hypothetical protein J4E06_11180 [Muricauda sp. NFXS6]|uniref:DUF5677 domain-containing protein n=1 Tax=Allomuricauda sp. NFXS6 TaxID=2819094 RepID=UPI0032DE2EDD
MDFEVVEDLLPRELNPELSKELERLSNKIDNAVDFGTNLIKWDVDKKLNGDENIPPLLFLRKILDLADSISVLVRNSCIDSCKPLIRSMIECVSSP